MVRMMPGRSGVDRHSANWIACFSGRRRQGRFRLAVVMSVDHVHIEISIAVADELTGAERTIPGNPRAFYVVYLAGR
jgi:hypothetical protein